MIYTNKKIEGFIITHADDLHLAETAINIAKKSSVTEVSITERLDGVIVKEAHVKHFSAIKELRFKK